MNNRVNNWAAGVAYGVLTALSVALCTSAAFSGGIGTNQCTECRSSNRSCGGFRETYPDSKKCFCGHFKAYHYN